MSLANTTSVKRKSVNTMPCTNIRLASEILLHTFHTFLQPQTTKPMAYAPVCVSPLFMQKTSLRWAVPVLELEARQIQVWGPYNRGSRGRAPSGFQGRAPGQGIRGAKPPWSWNTFGFWAFTESPKVACF